MMNAPWKSHQTEARHSLELWLVSEKVAKLSLAPHSQTHTCASMVEEGLQEIQAEKVIVGMSPRGASQAESPGNLGLLAQPQFPQSPKGI